MSFTRTLFIGFCYRIRDAVRSGRDSHDLFEDLASEIEETFNKAPLAETECAEFLGTSVKTVRKLREKGLLKSTCINPWSKKRRYVFPIQYVLARVSHKADLMIPGTGCDLFSWV